MIKYSFFILLVAMRIFYHPANAQTTTAPFASPSTLSTSFSATAKLLSVDAHVSNNKVILNWEVGENETADQFEIEKSTDGKNFSMAALVFGTDTPTGKYQFYEKAGNQKVSYRIKLINKDRQTEYSAIVVVNPNV